MNKTSIAELLYEALGQPIGLLCQSSEPERARQAMYRVRKVLGDPALDGLQFRASPLPDGNLLILKSQIQKDAL